MNKITKNCQIEEGFWYALYELEDCPDEEEFEDCFMDLAGYQEEAYEEGKDAEVEFSDLDSCTEYVFMAESFDHFGVPSVILLRSILKEDSY